MTEENNNQEESTTELVASIDSLSGMSSRDIAGGLVIFSAMLTPVQEFAFKSMNPDKCLQFIDANLEQTLEHNIVSELSSQLAKLMLLQTIESSVSLGRQEYEARMKVQQSIQQQMKDAGIEEPVFNITDPEFSDSENCQEEVKDDG